VTGHALIARGKTGDGSLLDLRVAVAAIDFELTHMMSVTEGDGLLHEVAFARDETAAIDGARHDEPETNRGWNSDQESSRDPVYLRSENLRHRLKKFSSRFEQIK
jgi:hypothetical protein